MSIERKIYSENFLDEIRFFKKRLITLTQLRKFKSRIFWLDPAMAGQKQRITIILSGWNRVERGLFDVTVTRPEPRAN